MNYKKIYVSQFENCTTSHPIGEINILQWLLKKPDCIPIIKEICATSDKVVSDMFKKKLPCITCSGTFYPTRKKENLVKHSGVICIDIDGKDNPEITNMTHLKKQISKLPYVLYAGLSVSGKGLFCLIPIAYPEEHLGHFLAIEDDFRAMRIKIDSSCSDITRLRICSYDPRPFLNLNATVYGKTRATPVAQVPRNTPDKIQRVNNLTLKTAPIQHEEEKPLSIEDYFLKPVVDVNSDKPIPVMAQNAKQKIKEFVTYIVGKKVDITEVYADWIIICIIIAANYSEEGRDLFHAISQFYPRYSPEECNCKYDDILNRGYKMPVSRLCEIAARYNL